MFFRRLCDKLNHTVVAHRRELGAGDASLDQIACMAAELAARVIAKDGRLVARWKWRSPRSPDLEWSGAEADAADTVHGETLIAFLRKLEQGHKDNDAGFRKDPSGYLVVTALNRVRQHLRDVSRRRRYEVLDHEGEASVRAANPGDLVSVEDPVALATARLDGQVTASVISEEVLQLSSEHACCLLLGLETPAFIAVATAVGEQRLWGKLSLQNSTLESLLSGLPVPDKEIGQHLGILPEAVRARRRKAVERLRRRLDKTVSKRTD